MKHLSVVFVVFLLFAVACKKKASPTLSSLYIKSMAKDWTWSRDYLSVFRDRDDIVETLADTLMPIGVNTSKSIVFMGKVFVYYGGIGEYMVKIDTTQKLVYVDPNTQGIFNGVEGEQNTIYIEYYYHQDSMVYVDQTVFKHGGKEWRFSTIN